MTAAETSPVLADAAHVLSDQLRVHLQRFARLVAPVADRLERRFLTRLKYLRFDQRQRTALAAITPGAAARILSAGGAPAIFFEHIEYHGRRLAKLNIPPSDIVAALQEYDRLLAPTLRQLVRDDYANYQWVREQLQFCAILTLNNAYYQVREAETQAFYELFRVELESRQLEELVQRFLQTLVSVSNADVGTLCLLHEESQTWVCKARVTRAAGPPNSNPPMVHKAARMGALGKARCFTVGKTPVSHLLDAEWQGRYHTCWSIPLSMGDRVAGAMQFGFNKPYEWLPRELELLTAAAERCLMAAEKARLMEDLAKREEQVRQLAEHMLHVEEMERRRISRELHDEAGQSLLCIRLQLEMLEESLSEEQSHTRGKLAEARDITEHTIVEMRRLIAALSPAVLEQLGLGAALRQAVNRFRRVHPRVRIRLHLGRLAELPKRTETIVYRLVQECMNNIGKHSKATVVNISVTTADYRLRLRVDDNGVGFRVEEALAKRESFGLSGIRERVALLGGQFEVESRPADEGKVSRRASGSKRGSGLRRGTSIRIELPIPEEAQL